MSAALSILCEIGEVAELRGAAAAGLRSGVLVNNAHLHLPPNFSAFTTVEQAMGLAEAQGCRIVGASNYYDYGVYSDFAAAAKKHGVFPLYGLEIICMIEDLRGAGVKINDPGNPGKMYICGKGITRFDAMTAEGAKILGIIRVNDSTRTSKMIDRLSAVLAERGLANKINADTVVDMIVRRHGVARETVYLQERHVAHALQEYIFEHVPTGERLAKIAVLLGAAPKMKSADDFVGLQNELRSHLMKAGKPGFVAETFIDFAPAMRLIRELGGFACYPILADGATPICPFEDPVEKLIASLKERGIFAAELITGRNSLATVQRYARALRGAGLVVTAGTEHNTLDLIGMEPVCLKNEPVPAELKEIFYEGACVVTAHQFLSAQGEVGYTDLQGRLNERYGSVEERIDELAKLGHVVVRRYLELGKTH